MKTSVLISSIAALYLVGTLAIAPRRHGAEEIALASASNIEIVMPDRPTVLPGVVITPEINSMNMETAIPVPAVPAEDYSYLKFDVTLFTEADAVTPDEAVEFPEAEETDYSYLEFNAGDYATLAETGSGEIKELPVADEFEYLRFDVNKYSSLPRDTGNGELPAEEKKTVNQGCEPLQVEPSVEKGQLKFGVDRYYNTDDQVPDEEVELPED